MKWRGSEKGREGHIVLCSIINLWVWGVGVWGWGCGVWV